MIEKRFATSALFLGLADYAMSRKRGHIDCSMESLIGLITLYPILVLDAPLTPDEVKTLGVKESDKSFGYLGQSGHCTLYTSSSLYPSEGNKYSGHVFGFSFDDNKITVDCYEMR